MKLSELHPCDWCGGVLHRPPHAGFYVVRISLAMLKRHAANQVLGLTQMFRGNLRLAEAMAPEQDAVLIAGDEQKELMDELLLCLDCVMQEKLGVSELLAIASGRRAIIDSKQANVGAMFSGFYEERSRQFEARRAAAPETSEAEDAGALLRRTLAALELKAVGDPGADEALADLHDRIVRYAP